MGSSPEVARGPGRPRRQADEQILCAARSLIGEGGLDAVTLDAVALRAGVGKSTLYSRYASRDDLTLAVLAGLGEPPHPTGTSGDLATDLNYIVEQLGRFLEESDLGQPIAQLWHDLPTDRPLAPDIAEFLAQRHEPILTVLEQAIERGELPEDSDLNLLYCVIVAPLYFGLLRRGGLSEAFRQGFVELLVRGIAGPADMTEHDRRS